MGVIVLTGKSCSGKDSTREELENAYEIYKKNQYGAYLRDILDGKYIDS